MFCFFQVGLMGLIRLVSVYYLMSFDRIIHNCMKTRDKAKKSEWLIVLFCYCAVKLHCLHLQWRKLN